MEVVVVWKWDKNRKKSHQFSLDAHLQILQTVAEKTTDRQTDGRNAKTYTQIIKEHATGCERMHTFTHSFGTNDNSYMKFDMPRREPTQSNPMQCNRITSVLGKIYTIFSLSLGEQPRPRILTTMMMVHQGSMQSLSSLV